MVQVQGIEQFANKIGQPAQVGDVVGILLPPDAQVRKGDILIGAQRAMPSSPAKIEAEVKQVKRILEERKQHE